MLYRGSEPFRWTSTKNNVFPAEAGIHDNMGFNFVFDAINPSCKFLKYLNINWDYFESKISSYSGLDSRLRGNDAGARDAAPFNSKIFPLGLYVVWIIQYLEFFYKKILFVFSVPSLCSLWWILFLRHWWLRLHFPGWWTSTRKTD